MKELKQKCITFKMMIGDVEKHKRGRDFAIENKVVMESL